MGDQSNSLVRRPRIFPTIPSRRHRPNTSAVVLLPKWREKDCTISLSFAWSLISSPTILALSYKPAFATWEVPCYCSSQSVMDGLAQLIKYFKLNVWVSETYPCDTLMNKSAGNKIPFSRRSLEEKQLSSDRRTKLWCAEFTWDEVGKASAFVLLPHTSALEMFLTKKLISWLYKP